MPKVTIIDYGIGNLLSVSRAFQCCGADVIITDSPDTIVSSDSLVLPGVGAFADGMEGLRGKGLIDPIYEFAASGRPFLGICLGMQMMLQVSEEFGNHKGLGLIPGKVSAIPPTGTDGKTHKIPSIGWNDLIKPNQGGDWEGTILSSVTPGSSVYFVHSFTAIPSSDDYRLADYSYNGRILSAAIKSGSLFGCQFHPEKSGEIGLLILRNFLDLLR